ncbi:aminopeptidase YwaD [Croceifilum oryzae]|uniref:Carboxypeptidase Q n=1 Tax=Croceifilum oryzae TaxID=1553429 RepID=A0AAJ1TDB3_9BACL|nr:M28 family peptidase [Croceifilum oryzae]MDQ0416429.1 aminopeptidase YwaD [Croceifilum oryzae]
MKKTICNTVMGLVLSIPLIFTTAFASGLPLQENMKAQSRVSEERIFQDIAWMANKDDARMAGTPGEHQAAQVIAQRFKKLGFEVELQRFPLTRFESHGATLTISQPENKSFETAPLTYSPRTPAQGLSADLVYAGLGAESDFASVNVKGKIALIKRGNLTFYDQTQNAAKAGAVGVVIFNNTKGKLGGSLEQQTSIPAIGLAHKDGVLLTRLLGKGKKVTTTMKADTEVINTYSQNVVGTFKAKNAKKAKTLVVGAHYDGVDSAAANDNASGTATMLEVARLASQKKLDMNVKFIAFGAEEPGMVGSEFYAKSLKPEEVANISGMVNIDMVGVGDEVNVFTASEDAQSFVADLAVEKAEKLQITADRGVSTLSDHASFEPLGIPVAFLNVGEDPNYHSDQDTLDKIQKPNLKNMGTIVTNLVLDIASTSPAS